MVERVIILVVAMIALYASGFYLWNQKYRPSKLKKGISTRSWGQNFNRVLSFIITGDQIPYNKVKVKFLTRSNVYMILIAVTSGLFIIGQYLASGLFLFVTLIVITGRTRKVFSERDQILRRMFEVATSEFRYGRGSELSPWSYVRVKKWDNQTIPGDTEVTFPAAFRSDDPRKREEFENHFNGTLGANNTWSYEWDGPKGLVQCRPVSHLPTIAPYPGSNEGWDKIPLGVGIDGPVYWSVRHVPHILICGGTGGGKSVAQRNIVFHCIQHSDRWRFLGVDLKRVELKPYKKFENVVLGIATELADGVEVMRFANQEMMDRYKVMEDLGVNNYMDLSNPPKSLLVMVDEAYMFMASTGGKSDEQKEADQLHAEATTIIGDIARLGRAAGVHLVVATQRPDAKVIYGEIKENLGARYAAGPLKSTASQMVLDSDSATRLPSEIKGRAIYSEYGKDQYIQGYFSKEDWMDEFLYNNGFNLDGSPRESGSSVTQESHDSDFMNSLPSDFEDGFIEDRFSKIDTHPPVFTDDSDEPELADEYAPSMGQEPSFAFENIEPIQATDDGYGLPFEIPSDSPTENPSDDMPRLIFSDKQKVAREEDTWDEVMEEIFSFVDDKDHFKGVESSS